MADIAENLQKFLASDGATALKVGTHIAQDIVPQAEDEQPHEAVYPFIWFQRTGVEMNRCLGETGNAPFSHTFAVECVSDDLDESQAVADLVRAACEGLACGGTFGDTTVSNVFCEDQADDYLPKAADLSEGEHVAALSVEVYP